MNSLPIRVRLTVWYFAMFATAASVLCVASLWMLRRSVEETEYYDLQERAEDVEALLSHETPNRTLQQIGGDLEAIYRFKDDGKYLQVRDEQGNWIFRSKRMIAENPPLPAPGRLPKRGLIEGFHQGIHEVWTLEYPIVANGKRYSVQTGIALDKSNLLLSNFRAKLLLLTPIMILLAAAGGHAMSRKALQPVAALAYGGSTHQRSKLEHPSASAPNQGRDLGSLTNAESDARANREGLRERTRIHRQRIP